MKRTYLTLIIIMLVIGFAAVSANLVLSGTLKIGFNSEDFEEGVIFTKAESINGTASIQENEKTINYQTYKLDEIGEESILDYDITNKSNQYDADVTVTCSLNDTFNDYSDYIELTQDLDAKFTLSAGATEKGRVKVKLKKSYVASDNTQIQFTCTIVATAKEKEETVEYKPETIYTEVALNGADPVLEGNSISTVSLEEKEEKKLIPVNISDNGTVTYADITTKWYDYENQKWANAVILSNYNHIPKVGEEIPEEDIESYFVWIPKYRYKIFDLGEYDNTNGAISDENVNKPIEIEFNINNTSDDNSNECTTPNKSGEKDSCAVDKWMTHPAFTSFGDIKGFWVAKFSVGYNQNTTSSLKDMSNWSKGKAQVNSYEPDKIIIKPNVYAWRWISVENMFKNSYDYARNLDSHMMKNTEWGAVAYLSHSKYGTCKDNTCTEVRINNNSLYLTGFAAKKAPTTGYKSNDTNSLNADTNNYGETLPNHDSDYSYNYFNKESQMASTTGNYTGVYDMSGCAWEYVFGVKSMSDTNNFYDIEIDNKYYDLYIVDSTPNIYTKRILGDATGELGPFSLDEKWEDFSEKISSWYHDAAYFAGLSSDHLQYFVRGGQFSRGTGAGLYAYSQMKGYNEEDHAAQGSYRLVLAPTN